jgi:autophagy-related protein 11
MESLTTHHTAIVAPYEPSTVTQRQTTLKGIFSMMASEQHPVPEDPAQLVNELEELAQRSVDHAKELAEAVAIAKSENDSLQVDASGTEG